MTTANLSVGINTSKAKEDLAELKRHMATVLTGVIVNIDGNYVDKQLETYVTKQRTFKFKVDNKALRDIASEIENEVGVGLSRAFNAGKRELRWNYNQFASSLATAFKESFSQPGRRILFNKEALTSEIRESVAAGFMTSHTVKVHADISAAKAELGALQATVVAPPRAPLSAAPTAPAQRLTSADLPELEARLKSARVELDAAMDRARSPAQRAQSLLDSMGRVPPSGSAKREEFDQLNDTASKLRDQAIPLLDLESRLKRQIAAIKETGEFLVAPKASPLPTPSPSPSVAPAGLDAASLGKLTGEVRAALQPSLEALSTAAAELAKSATTMGAHARKVSDAAATTKVAGADGEEKPKGTGVRSISRTGADGYRETYRERVDSPDAIRAVAEAEARNKSALKAALSNPSGLDQMGQAVIKLDARVAEALKRLPTVAGTAAESDKETFRARRSARAYDERQARVDQSDANRTYQYGRNFVRSEDAASKREATFFTPSGRTEIAQLESMLRKLDGVQRLVASSGGDTSRALRLYTPGIVEATKTIPALTQRLTELQKAKAALDSAKQDQRAGDAAAKREATFFTPTGKTEIAQLESMLRKLDGVQRLVASSGGDTGRALRLYTPGIVEATKTIPALTQRLTELQKAKAALDSAQSPDSSRNFALQIQDGWRKLVDQREKQREALAKQDQAKSDSNTKKNAFFEGITGKDALSELEARVKRVTQAQTLVAESGGKTGLAIETYGSKAVAAIPRLQSLIDRLSELKRISAEAEALRKFNPDGPSRQDIYRLQDAAAVSARKNFNPDGPSRQDIYRLQDQAKARAAKNENDRLASIFNMEKASSKAGGLFNSEGDKIFAARRLAILEGNGTARKFLGKDSYLLDLAAQINNYRAGVRGMGEDHLAAAPKINKTTEAHKAATLAMSEGHSAVRGLAGGLGMLWATWGSTVPLLAGAAIAASLKGIYDEGKKAEYQLAFIKGLTGTKLDLQSAETVASGSMFGTSEAMDGLRALTQSGLSAREALASLPEVLNLATVGEVAVGDAAFAATGVLKAFGLEVSEIGRVSDVMAKASAMSNASVKDMMEAFKYASASSALYGASLEEVGAAVAMLSEKNIKGSMAGTAHMNLLKEIYTPTKKASEAFKALGLDMQEMQRAGLTSTQMLDKIREKTAKLDSTALRQFTAAVGGERGNRELSPLLSAGTKSLSQFQDELENSRGFTRSVMIELQNTVEGSSARMKQALSLAFAGAFEDGRGQVQKFNDALAAAFNGNEFRSAIQGLANGMLNLTTVVMDHAGTIGNLVMVYGGLKVITTVASMAQSAVRPIVALSEAYLAQGIAAERAGVAATTAQARLGLVAEASIAASGGVAALTRALSFAASALGTIMGIVGTGLVLWELFASKQDVAREAQDRFANSVNNVNRALDQEIQRLERRQYLRDNPGKTDQQATLTTEVEALKRYVDSYESAFAALKKPGAISAKIINESGDEQEVTLKGMLAQQDKFLESKQRLSSSLQKLAEVNRRTALDEAATAQASLRSWLAAAQDGLAARRLVASAADRAKIDSAKDTLDNVRVDSVSNSKQADTVKRALQVFADAGGAKLNLPDPTTDARLRKDALATLAEKKSSYKRQLDELEAYYKAEEAILKAKESAKLITTEEYEARIEASGRAHEARRLQMAETSLDAIKKWAEANPDLKDPADKTRLNTWKSEAENDVNVLREKIRTAVEVAGIKTQGKLEDIDRDIRDMNVEAVLRDMKALRQLAAEADQFQSPMSGKAGAAATASTFEQGYVSTLSTSGLGDAAKAAINAQREQQRRDNFEARQRQKYATTGLMGKGAPDTVVKAAMQAFDEAEPAVVKWTKAVADAQVGIAKLQQQKDNLWSSLENVTGTIGIAEIAGQIDQTDAYITAAERRLTELQRGLAGAKANQEFSVDTRASAAKAIDDYRRTPEYGMQSFFDQYTKSASDSATLVSNIMSQSANSIEQALGSMSSKSSLHFKQLTRSILADAARMWANQQFKQLISMGLNWAVGAVGGLFSGSTSTVGTMAPGSGAGASASTVGMGYANGGIHSTYGTIPLKKYATGGVAYSPQMAIYGEGRRPEAYVPLPDGRTIPVTMKVDGPQGGSGQGVQVNISVQVQSDGSSKVESDASGKQGAALAKAIEAKVTEVIIKEKRAGGLLAA